MQLDYWRLGPTVSSVSELFRVPNPLHNAYTGLTQSFVLVTLGSLACQTTGVRVPDPKAVLASPRQSPSYMCGLTNTRRNTRNCFGIVSVYGLSFSGC